MGCVLKNSFEQDLKRAADFHGHLCAGQVVGVRMSRYALGFFGIEDPAAYRDLVAFVECDRCLADAICSVCRCTLGRRKLKWYDYGIMSATFYDMRSKVAIRISQPQTNHCPKGVDPIKFFEAIPDEKLFNVDMVELPGLNASDLPGKHTHGIACEVCGELINNRREVHIDGHVLCKRCAGEQVYYRVLRRLDPAEVQQGVQTGCGAADIPATALPAGHGHAHEGCRHSGHDSAHEACAHKELEMAQA